MLDEAKGVLYPNITIPLYAQLRDILVHLIESGELKAGDELPGERELSELYSISRVTVRKCLGTMAEEGHIVRSRGRKTIVAEKKIQHNLGPLIGVVEEFLNNQSIHASVEVLHAAFETPSINVRNNLKLDPSDKSHVYAFFRLLKNDDQPLAINYSFVPYNIGKIVESLDLRKDKVFTYLEHCGYNISYGYQLISSSLCSTEEAAILKYSESQAVLVIRRTTFLENGFPILYEKTVFRGDAYQYSIRLQRKL